MICLRLDAAINPGEGADGGGISGMNAAKPVTTVRVCVSTRLSVTPLDVFLDEGPLCFNICTCDTAGYFEGEFTSIPAVFMQQNILYFCRKVWTFVNLYFKSRPSGLALEREH